MRSSNQTGRTSGKPSGKTSPSMLTVIGTAVIVVSILIMFIFTLSAGAGSNKRNPEVIFYGFEGNFPRTSMNNTLHAAGFDYSVSDSMPAVDDERYYVIATSGDKAIDAINEFKDSPSVLGFVLICPSIRDGQSLDGISSSYPDKDIAIFSGRDDATAVSDIGDARILYERLSGDDTVYGVGVKRGGLFASTCFINNNQTRYLSLSSFKYETAGAMIFSPLFQNELAGYLGITYQHSTIKDVSFSRINSWFVMLAIAIFAFIFGEALYLAFLPVVMTDNVHGKVTTSNKISIGVTGGITLAALIGVIALSFRGELREFIPYITLLLPLVLLMLLAIFQLKFILEKDTKRFTPKGKFLRPVFMAATIALFVVLVSVSFGDMNAYLGVPQVIVTMGSFLVDVLSAAGLLYADRKSRSIGQGGRSFFGNIILLVMVLLPSIVALIIGLIFGVDIIRNAGIGGLVLVLAPYLALVPVRRHSDNVLIPAVLHGIVFTALFLLIA